jgi:hypothetical protein
MQAANLQALIGLLAVTEKASGSGKPSPCPAASISMPR